MADGGGGNGQGEGDAHQNGDGNTHPEGLEGGGAVDQGAKGAGRTANGGRNQVGQDHAGKDCDGGSDQKVHFCLFGYGLSGFGSQNGDKQHSQRAACAAHSVGGLAHRRQREQHQRRGLECVTDGDGHSRGGHGRGKAAHLHQKFQPHLLAQGFNDGADEQGTEQPLGHGPQGVDTIAFRGNNNIFPL